MTRLRQRPLLDSGGSRALLLLLLAPGCFPAREPVDAPAPARSAPRAPTSTPAPVTADSGGPAADDATFVPCLSLPRTTLISGLGPLQPEFGYSVVGAGDTNGDGFNDLVVGATGDDAGDANAGALLVYLGSAAGVSSTPATIVYGTELQEALGYSAAAAGDIDGDGYADIVAGSSELVYETFVYMGSAAGIGSDPPVPLHGPGRSSNFGFSVAGGGDFNADGFDDVLVSAPHTDDGGILQVHYGSASGIAADPALSYGNPYDPRATWFPSDVSGAGDVNGDGVSDIAVGYYGYEVMGWAAVYLGDPTGAHATPDWELTGEYRNQNLGQRITADADFDADGYTDVIVRSGGRAGSLLVYSGSATGPATVVGATLAPSADVNLYGTHGMSDGGDLDGDGYEDFALAVEYVADGAVVEVFFGAAAGLAETPELTLPDPYPRDASFGWSLDIAPDLTGDGVDDLVVGAPDFFNYTGRADVYSGHARDQDGDGFGADTDCDDADPTRHPRAAEVCDGVDQDCDEVVDDHPIDGALWYADADADGYGDAAAPWRACAQPAGKVADATDCDDHHATVHPDASEVCDPDNLDEDCDGLADDADADVDTTTRGAWYPDADADTWGDPASPLSACDAPSGTTTRPGDCDDTRADIRPNAPEVCDPLNTDEDCDTLADDADATVAPGTRFTWYADADADTWGDPASPLSACDAPAFATARPGDCDDSRADIHPGADEVCDDAESDEDCDRAADDADPSVDRTTQTTWYADSDADGHGDRHTPIRACAAPAGATATADDCDDTNANVNPDATEQCGNGHDDDCDPATVDACPDPGDDTASDSAIDSAIDSGIDSAGATGDKPAPGCGCASRGDAGNALTALIAGLGALIARRRRE